MNTQPDIIQALMEQDLDQVKQCLVQPGFDIHALTSLPKPLSHVPRQVTWLEIALIAPPHVPSGLDAIGSVHARSRARQARTEIVQALVAAGLDPNAKGEPNTVPPLFLAIERLGAHARYVVPILLKAGADPKTKTALLRTALHLAVLPNRVADDEGLHTIKALLEYGADPNACDDTQQTPLHWAIGNDYSHNVLVLLNDHGARWDAPDIRQQTPLERLRLNHPAHIGWWMAYPGFRALEADVAKPTPDSGPTSPSPRF